MNATEHLLVVLGEECAEVQQNIAKALRFGLDDHHPDKTETNRRLITNELADLFAVYEMLVESKELPRITAEQISKKKTRVYHWMQHAKNNKSLENGKEDTNKE